jgi:hypothetical protein
MTRATDRHVVEWALTLPAAESGWTEAPRTTPLRWSEGLSSAAGSAQLEHRWGTRSTQADPIAGTYAPTEIPAGAVIRIVRIDASGRTPVWWGTAGAWTSDPEARTSTCEAPHIVGMLARIMLTRGLELTHGGLLTDPGILPPFNAWPGGDRSAAASGGTFVHDRIEPGNPWTAEDASEYLLRLASEPVVGATSDITWRFYWPAPVGADYQLPRLDRHGTSVAQSLDAIWSPGRRLGWRLREVSGTTVWIEAVLLDGSGGIDVDLTTSASRSGSAQREAAAVDGVIVDGAPPWVAMTLQWAPGESDNPLIPDGWEPGTAADAVLDEWDDSVPYDRPEWRAFRLNPAWNGRYLPPVWALADLAGIEQPSGPDGARAWSSPAPAVSALRIERLTPAGLGWTSSAEGPRQPPVVVAGVGPSLYDDLSAHGLTPVGSGGDGDGAAAGVLLGTTQAHAAELRDLMGQTGAALYVTVGLREWAPLRAYHAPQRPYAGAAPLIRHHRLAGAERWRVAAKTVRGVAEDGTLAFAEASTIRDDIAALIAARDELWARYGTSRGRARWREDGRLRHDLRPGDAVARVIGADRTVQVDGHIALIVWDATFGGYGTDYTAAPLRPGEDA